MSSDPKKKQKETSSPQIPPPPPQQQQVSSQPSTPQQPTPQQPSYRLPTDTTFQNAFKLAITEDKPLMMDYWVDSLDGKALIGVRENNEKMLVKSAEEYTSPIAKLYRSGTEYIIMTENSIYLVSSTIPSRRIA
jgi:hypothetical protein